MNVVKLPVAADLSVSSYEQADGMLAGNYRVLVFPASLERVALAICEGRKLPPFLVWVPDEMLSGRAYWSLQDGHKVIWSDPPA